MADKLKNHPPLPVSMDKTKKLPAFPAVQLVSQWALLTACLYAGTSIHIINHQTGSCTQSSSWWSRCIELTGAAGVEASALVYAQLWCSAPQAAAEALAMMLAGRRRRALAYVALAATVANDSMHGRLLVLVFVADPGDLFLIIVGTACALVSVALDLLGLLALLLGGEE